MSKHVFSRFSLFFVFSFLVFNLMWFTTGCIGVLLYILERLGVLRTLLYKDAYIVIIGILLLLSTSIGALVTSLGGKLVLKPIQEMLVSMKRLATGDFGVRIKSFGWLCPKELVEFSEQFNITAKELGSIEMLRSDFVNNFSHEFKTPIVSLKGFAKLLKSGNLGEEEEQEYLDIMIAESNRLAALATNVLNLTKIENQSIITEKCRFNLSEQVRRMILMLESKWSEKDLELDVELEEDIHYCGNAELLSQVWVNVLDNAIKFSPEKSKLIVRLSEYYDSVIFKVQDFGCGMDEEVRLHMFDKFYQGNQSHSTEGNGLGMSVAKKVVSLHKGKISVESVCSKGTTIFVSLPKIWETQYKK